MKTVLGPAVGYVDLLNHETTEALKREMAEGKLFSKTPLRPSAAGKCTRELFYELMMFHKKANYPVEVNTPSTQRLLDLGHYIESHAIKQFERHLKMVQVRYKQQVLSFGEIKAVNEAALSQYLEGSLDVCLWSEQWKCVVDFKSKKDKWSNHRSSGWEDLTYKLSKMRSVQTLSNTTFWVEDLAAFLEELRDPFFEANFVQLNLYAMSDFLRERGVDHAAIIQYNKNTSDMREIRFKPSAAVAAGIVAKFTTALHAAETGSEESAPRDHMLGSMKCAFCKFAGECWGQDARKAWFKSMPPKEWPTDTVKMGKAGKELEKLFASYEKLEASLEERKKVEESIIKVMGEKEAVKVRLTSGDVFEAKFLKSPYPHLEIRRSKA